MEGQYNLRSPAVKRLMREAQELHEATEEYFAQPLEDNLFEWHFTVRGPPESEFEGGVYHGRVILPPDYPMKPPSIILLTPNGRFETNKKICLSISGHHPESWQPSWSLRTALLAIIGFMPTHGSGAIGSLDYSAQERKQLAKKSQSWSCPSCGPVAKLLKEHSQDPQDDADREAREQAAQITFKEAGERPSTPSEPKVSDTTPATPPQQEPVTNGSEPPEVLRRRIAAQILAQRAEQFLQQQQQSASREQASLVAGPEARASGTATATVGNNLRLAYNATIWVLGSAFLGLLIRRIFFL